MKMESNYVDFNGEQLFLIEGVVSELQFARSSINLLTEIEANAKNKSSAAGVIAALTEMHGVLANSFVLSMYEGEDTFNFAGYVDGKVVFGVLSQAVRLKDGDAVKLVVSQRDDVFFIHSLLRQADDLLMLPTMVYAGERAFFKSCMRTAFWSTVSIWVVFFIGAYFLFRDVSLPREREVILFCMILFVPPIFIYLLEYRTYAMTKYYGLYASAIFAAFRLPDPDYLDVRSGLMNYRDGNEEYSGINLRVAIEKHNGQR